jgi:hypothetical protein
VWISKKSGLPIIIGMQSEQSQFGETTKTATIEGADQPEISSLAASQFGETRVTRSEGEGIDQPAFATLSSSQFGESTKMKIVEGVDEPTFFDGVASQFGETTITKTQEGADRPEMSLLLSELTISNEAF